ncbi:hypothetical protein ACFX5U_20940 [Sphingobacterium sp. SG20118]|uniref:hypothetical protein n=1 Tax=Sphingobacterium sp. SG20118 TaxID=3367156 RepID=UPI0037DFC860
MKNSIIAILLYFLILHVFLPGCYYLFNGFRPVYSEFIDLPSLVKGFYLIVTPFVISIIILWCLPKQDDVIKPHISGRPVTVLFYFSILLKLAIIYTTGGFAAAVNGETNGTLSNYISIFFNPFTLLLVMLFVQEKKSNIILAVLFYVLSVTLSGSRSGIISMFFVFFIGFSFAIFDQYKQRLFVFLKFGILLAPVLFVFATSLREVEGIFTLEFILDQIVGRMSTLETSMLPIYYYDNNLALEVFYEKFSVLHQLKLCIDSILPGQIFEFDVMPNNYYRFFFLGYEQNFVIENYMSVNLTLPVYLYMKYKYFSIIFVIIYVLSFYYLILFFRKYPMIVIVLLSVFYNLIYFFDWVMIFTQFYTSLLTIVVLKVYLLTLQAFEYDIKKKRDEIKN